MKKTRKRAKWKDENYHLAYQMAKDGMSDFEIARAFGVALHTVEYWRRTKPAFQKALDDARRSSEDKGKTYDEFREFVHGRLPEEAQRLWDEIDGLSKEEGMPKSDPDELRHRKRKYLDDLHKASRRIRQSLFIHALLNSNFQVSLAAQKIGISLEVVKSWIRTEKAFASLVHGMHECKKDFFESALLNLVRQGDSAAIIFANKTLNKDRGYGDRITIDVNKKVEHTHSLRATDLPVEVQRGLLDAMRRKQLEDRSDVVDAEVVK